MRRIEEAAATMAAAAGTMAAVRNTLRCQLEQAMDLGLEVEVELFGGDAKDPAHCLRRGLPEVDGDGYVQLRAGEKESWWYSIARPPSDGDTPTIVGVKLIEGVRFRAAAEVRSGQAVYVVPEGVYRSVLGDMAKKEGAADRAYQNRRLKSEDNVEKVRASVLGAVPEEAEMLSVTGDGLLRPARFSASGGLGEGPTPELEEYHKQVEAIRRSSPNMTVKEALAKLGIESDGDAIILPPGEKVRIGSDQPASVAGYATLAEPMVSAAGKLLGLDDEPTESNPAARRTWAQFRESGMLWLVNRSLLHLLGWAIVVVEDDETGEITCAHPARTTWRGFPPERDELGFRRVTTWMRDHAEQLMREVEPDDSMPPTVNDFGQRLPESLRGIAAKHFHPDDPAHPDPEVNRRILRWVHGYNKTEPDPWGGEAPVEPESPTCKWFSGPLTSRGPERDDPESHSRYTPREVTGEEIAAKITEVCGGQQVPTRVTAKRIDNYLAGAERCEIRLSGKLATGKLRSSSDGLYVDFGVMSLNGEMAHDAREAALELNQYLAERTGSKAAKHLADNPHDAARLTW